MIATDRFVFLHLHKSGGTFVNECLLRFVPEARQIGYHLPRKLIPPALAQLPVLGLVRNPWSYYVSWHSFQARQTQPNALYRVLSDGGQLDFAGTIRNMLDLGATGARLDELVAALPSAYTNRGLNIPAGVIEAIRGSGLGFYSYLYRYMYDGPGILHMARMERMREELPPMLTAAGHMMSGPMRSYLLEARARNTSEHGSYVDYYDDALKSLVAERDADLIARFGYRFGD
ncbi:MAG: hypothetical protein ABI885_13660 [Gammaproteobacteria bacterium]